MAVYSFRDDRPKKRVRMENFTAPSRHHSPAPWCRLGLLRWLDLLIAPAILGSLEDGVSLHLKPPVKGIIEQR